ncbi:MAG: helix-turn-helix domain-containing protein [Candidatus Acidiferrum sp.]
MARGNFGERLKRERELREVSLEEITSATRIGPRFLEALENEEWEKLPGGVFNRGFVRSVARYLGLDEESFLAEYDLAHGPVVQPSVQNNANHFSSRPKWIPFAAFLLLLALAGALAAGGYYGWRYYTAHRAAKQSLLPPATPSSREAKSAALSTPLAPPAVGVGASDSLSGTPLDLYISLAQPSHLRVVADGQVIADEDFPSGANRHFPANEQFEVVASNAGAVLLELNGQAMPPLGTLGASGTIAVSRKDLRPSQSGITQP